MQRNKKNMDDEQRLEIASHYIDDWFEHPDDMDHPDANPRALCGRVLLRMALVGLIEDIEQRAAHEPSGGPLVDCDKIAHGRQHTQQKSQKSDSRRYCTAHIFVYTSTREKGIRT